MWLTLIALLCPTHIFIQQCFGIKYIDLPGYGGEDQGNMPKDMDSPDLDDATVREVAPDQVIYVKKPTTSNIEDMRRRLNYESDVKVQKDNPEKLNDIPDSKVEFEYYDVKKTSTSDQNLEPKDVTSSGRRALKKDCNGKDSKDSKDIDGNLKHKIATLVDQTMYDTDIKVKSIMKAKDKHKDNAAYKVGFILSMVKRTRDMLSELYNVAVKHRDDWKALEQLKVFELIAHTNVDTTNLVRQLVEVHMQKINVPSIKAARQRVVVL